MSVPAGRTADTDADSAKRLRAELEFLSQLCSVVASNTELEPILDWIVRKTTSMLGADEGSLKLLGPDAASPTAQTIIRQPAAGVIESGSWPMPVTTTVMGFLMYKGEALHTPDLLSDPRFPGLRSVNTRIRGVLAVPLRVDNRITGMLAVTTLEPGREWNADAIQLLTIVASNSAGVIEQARLRDEARKKEELEKEKRQMERELDLARDIQMGLVPSRPMIAGPWEVHGMVIPARQVGGDYFDYFPFDERRFGLALADVSGKGVPASLLVSSVQASLRAFCDGRRSLPEAVGLLNRSVARASTAGKFVTLFYAEVDHARGVLRYSNAGHNYPLLRRRDGSVLWLENSGLILGILDEVEYEEVEIPFGAGDALLVYSDGIPEAENGREDQFSDERLFELWGEVGALPAREMIPRLVQAVAEFRGSAAQSDDITALVVASRGE
jgi:sigma-B regulation protein RsbU (phosphoserine phosphatase)